MKNAQALIFVFLLLTIVGILVFALSMMWQSEIGVSSFERDSLTAFYLAQAGIERAKIRARHSPGSTPYDSGWINMSGGRYRFFIQNLGGVKRRIISRGQRLDAGSNVAAEKYITVEITNIENPFVNPSDDTEVDWSWREY